VNFKFFRRVYERGGERGDGGNALAVRPRRPSVGNPPGTSGQAPARLPRGVDPGPIPAEPDPKRTRNGVDPNGIGSRSVAAAVNPE
jgi:hypothetical protein